MGYDGKLYVLDWGGGWKLNNRGNIFTLHFGDTPKSKEVRELKILSATNLDKLSVSELGKLLSHAAAVGRHSK